MADKLGALFQQARRNAGADRAKQVNSGIERSKLVEVGVALAIHSEAIEQPPCVVGVAQRETSSCSRSSEVSARAPMESR